MEKPRGFRWVMLFLSWFTAISLGMAWFCTPPLIESIGATLNLTVEQQAFILSMPILMFVFFSVPAGIICAKIGPKKTAGIAVTVAFLSTILRYFSSSYIVMLGGTALIGIGFALAFPNFPHCIAMWFPPREIGTATGIFTTSLAVGSGIAIAATPSVYEMVGSWQTTYLVFGVIVLLFDAIWWILAKDHPPMSKTSAEHAPPTVSLKEGLSRVASSKNIWLLVLTFFFMALAMMGTVSLLPMMFLTLKGMDLATAGFVASLLMWGVAVGNIAGPAISQRIGLRKPLLYIGLIIPAALIYAQGMVTGTLLPIVIFVAGFFLGFPLALLMAVPMELKEMSPLFVGSAIGLLMTFGMGLGGFIGPFISGFISLETLFTVYAVAFAISSVFLIPLAETGPRKKSK
jgi:cyanate permease